MSRRSFNGSPEELAARSNRKFRQPPLRTPRAVLEVAHEQKTEKPYTDHEVLHDRIARALREPNTQHGGSSVMMGMKKDALINAKNESTFGTQRSDQPPDKGYDRRPWRAARYAVAKARPEKDDVVPRTSRDHEGLVDHGDELTFVMRMVREHGLDELDINTLLSHATTDFNRDKKPQIKNRFENLKDVLSVPLDPEKRRKNIATVGDVVRECFRVVYDFCARHDRALHEMQMYRYQSPEHELAAYINLWLGWYGQVYNTKLNRVPAGGARHIPFVLDNFSDGLNKCAPDFSDRLPRPHAFDKKYRDIYVDEHDVSKKINELVALLPYRTPEENEWLKAG